MESNDSFVSHSRGSIQGDVFSGLTVALALVPEAVAFSFVAGISPMIGLFGAFMMCFITAVLGGRPGMISGATGAMAVVMVNLVMEGNALAGLAPMPVCNTCFVHCFLSVCFRVWPVYSGWANSSVWCRGRS